MIKKQIVPQPDRLDFERWARVAKENPSQFEAMRRRAIEEVISRAPQGQQQRLRGLQWRIDQERRLAKNPLNACIRISRMMWESVTAPGGLQDSLKRMERPQQQTRQPSRMAEVVSLRSIGD